MRASQNVWHQNVNFLKKMGALGDSTQFYKFSKNMGSLGEGDAKNGSLNSLTYVSPPKCKMRLSLFKCVYFHTSSGQLKYVIYVCDLGKSVGTGTCDIFSFLFD